MSDFASFDMGGGDDNQGGQQQGFYAPPPDNQNNGFPPQNQGYAQQQPPAQQPGMDAGAAFGMAANMFGGGNPAVLNPMAGMAQNMVQQQIGDIGNTMSQYVGTGGLKHYFQVDTQYVLKKLRILLFPFVPGAKWTREGKDGKFLPPKDDINSPDLYIPVMAFLTYVLVAGVTTGASSIATFSAGELGNMLSNALGFLLCEVLVCYAAVWLMNIADLNIYDIIAFTGYKFIGMVLTVLSYLMTHNSLVFHAVLGWTALTLSFTLIQTIRSASDSNKKLLYFAIALAIFQVFFMWWFTSGVTTAPSATAFPDDDDMPSTKAPKIRVRKN